MNKRNTIYNVDSFELLKSMDDESIDLTIIDPPYGIDFQSNHRAIKYDKIANDKDIAWVRDYLILLHNKMKKDTHLYCFCSHHVIDVFKQYIQQVFDYKNILIWNKNNWSMGDLVADYGVRTEFIVFAHKGRREINGSRDHNVLNAARTGNELHPTQKPVPIIEYLIKKSSNEGDLVFDGFMGSGTTAVAAVNAKRDFIGAELDPDYFHASLKRIELSQKTPLLF